MATIREIGNSGKKLASECPEVCVGSNGFGGRQSGTLFASRRVPQGQTTEVLFSCKGNSIEEAAVEFRKLYASFIAEKP